MDLRYRQETVCLIGCRTVLILERTVGQQDRTRVLGKLNRGFESPPLSAIQSAKAASLPHRARERANHRRKRQCKRETGLQRICFLQTRLN